MTSTRLELRRLIGDVTGDMLLLDATGAGNTTSFPDTARLADRGDRAATVINRLLYFSGGTVANLGHEAAVTDFTSSTRTLTFSPAAPSAVASGDDIELWSAVERIGSISAIHRLINYAIKQVEDMAGLEEYNTAATFNARTGLLTIPATWTELGGAEYTAPGGYVREIPSRWLKVRPAGRKLEIVGHGARMADRRSVRLFGYPRCVQLTTDADATTGTTPVDAAWIVNSVAEALTLAPSWRASDPAAAERRANFWAAQAQLYKREVASGRRGLHISLP